MLKIHGIPRSRAFRCIWAAEEAGLPYEVVPLGFAPGFKLERPLAINPNNKIPALEDGNLVLFESLEKPPRRVRFFQAPHQASDLAEVRKLGREFARSRLGTAEIREIGARTFLWCR